MLRANLVLPILSILLVPPQTAPPVPFVDEGACPFECCTYRDWTATAPVAVYDNWKWQSLYPSSPHKTLFSVAKGEIVTALTAVVITTRPGRVRFTGAITARNFPRQFPRMPAEDIVFTPDDTLYLLTYRGEGAFAAWFKGRLLENLDTVPLQGRTGWPGIGVLESKPITQWWVRVRNGKGLIGWTNQPENFKNKDACGG
jgi:hypothetical protein